MPGNAPRTAVSPLAVDLPAAATTATPRCASAQQLTSQQLLAEIERRQGICQPALGAGTVSACNFL
jgi:hypothetical protein